MQHSEIYNTFDGKRESFRPYGLTCELWKPFLMERPDRHNEVEINYIPNGSVSYLIKGSKITVPAKSLALFWGLVSHQIVDYENDQPYFVCTIPLSVFLEWKLPAFFVDRVLKGEVLIEKNEGHFIHDNFLMENWIKDYSINKEHKVILLEMHARLLRMSKRISPCEKSERFGINSNEISKVEQIALFIAQNYLKTIKAVDISKNVGLHPDYANVIFKKAFGLTINEYIIQERVLHAQRKLISTDKSITDILYDSGFNSVSRFNAAFRKINKCTPKEFRKKFL